MEYFYSYLNGEDIHRKLQDKLVRDYPKISKDCIYIDVNDCAQWLNLKNIICHDDKLYIYEINYLADEPSCFKNRLLFLKKYNIQLKILNEIIYVFLTIFLYLLKCPQSLILSALRAFLLLW